MPKVSVVIPTYNYARFLGEAIQSALDQTFDDFELIIVDDGSTDNTKELIAGFADPRVKYIYQENRGSSAAYNTGISASEGEYIAFLDSDDIWFPQKLELQVKLLDSRPDVALVCSDTYLFDDQTGSILGRFWHDKQFYGWIDPQGASQRPLRYLLLCRTFIGESMAMVRREVFAEVGGFDESLKSHMDWDMFVRISQRFAIETIDMPLTKKRYHGARLACDPELMYEGSEIVLNKAIRSYSLQPGELRLVKRRLARVHATYGRRSVIKGKPALGREKLLASIKVYPWRVWPYIWLAVSFLNRRLFLGVKSSKKWLEHRFVRLRRSDNGISARG